MSKLRTDIDELGPDAARLLRIYRAHATEQPSAALDQRILQMASEAIVPARSAGSPSAPSPRRQHWLRYAASVAVVVVGAGLSWRMLEQGPSPDLAISRPQVAEGRSAAPGGPAPAAPADQAASARRDTQELAAAQADRVESQGTERMRLGQHAEPTISIASEEAVAAAAPPPAKPTQNATTATSAAPTLDDRTAPAPASAAAPPMLVQRAAAQAQPDPSDSARPEAAAKRVQKMMSPLDPAVWLDNIRALRDSKHEDEARVSLREWRLRYPQLPIPADLQPLLEPATRPDQP